MSATRIFHVVVKGRKVPTEASHGEIARTGLIQQAAKAGCVLTRAPEIVSTSYDSAYELHEATFSALGRRLYAPWAKSRMGPEVLLLRAHRNALHAFQSMTGAVNEALATRDAKAALVALHMLGCPTYPDEAVSGTYPVGMATQVALGAEACAALWGNPAGGAGPVREESR